MKHRSKVYLAALITVALSSLGTTYKTHAATCPNITMYLSIGARNAQVVELKKFLTEEGILSSVTYTNYFGPTTEKALKKWQAREGIVVSGTPKTTGYGATGPRTRSALNKKCTTKNSIPLTQDVTRKPSSYTPPSLYHGARGADVTQLQTILRATGDYTTTELTHVYDNNTVAAVQAFQCRTMQICNGTPETNGFGVVGPATHRALDALGITHSQATPQGCMIAGCSQTQCVPVGASATTTGTCAWKPEYSCYQGRTCALQSNGQCGWNEQVDISKCIARATYQQPTPATATPQTSTTYTWITNAWSTCSNGTQSRTARCVDEVSRTVADTQCSSSSKPLISQSCSSPSESNCNALGQTISHGTSITAYTSATVASGATCQSQSRTCINGTLTGDTNYQFLSCTTTIPRDCTFNGQVITEGSSVQAYKSEHVGAPASCASVQETRTCTNGALSGSFTFATCQAARTQSTRTVTQSHRYDDTPPGTAFGGWGPHLGHTLRAPDGTLWYADDTGSDVQSNAGIAYYTLSEGKWTHVATNNFFGRVQQNVASIILSNGIIYSYGIDVDNHRVEECYLNTRSPSQRACNHHTTYTVDPNANYIGAAVTPDGATMVWWTDISYTGGGYFSHIYRPNSTFAWQGVFRTHLGSYNGVSYVTPGFLSQSRVVLVGEGVTGSAPNWSYDALYGVGTIGQPIQFQKLQSSNGVQFQTTNDVWVDIRGGIHILGYFSDGSTRYFYKAPTAAIPIEQYTFPGTYRARFVANKNGDLHTLIAPPNKGLQRITTAIASLTGPIPYGNLTPSTITLPSGYETLHAIFPESEEYQTAPVSDLNAVVNGSIRQGELVHVQELY